MFGPEIVIGAKVYVELLKLIAVSQRALGYVQHVLRVFVHSEDQRLSGVLDRAADLQPSSKQHNIINVYLC